MTEPKIISVSMGEVAVAKHGETLKSILGSCVGIGFLLRERNVFGLAHCVLPYSPSDRDGNGARFVDQAVPFLLQSMGIRKSECAQVEAILIGGASLLATKKFEPAKSNIGAQNIESASKCLAHYGIRIIFESVGRDFGRQILIDGKTGEYAVQKIGTLASRRAV